MSPRPTVAVVFAVLNHRATLPALLRALDDTDWPGLVAIAVDCGSADGSLDLLRRRAATAGGVPLQLIELPGGGRATALRTAMQAAGRSDVVRLHADVVPDAADWLRQLWSVLERHPECGIVGGKISLPSGRIQSCGRDLINGLGIAPDWSDRRFMEADRDERSAPQEVDGVAGELCWIRRSVLDATGGPDPNYDPVHGCDDDLCLLARWHGHTVLVEPAVRGVHYSPRWTQLTPEGVPEPTGLAQQQRHEREQLRQIHRDYFRRKWGFDPQAPDLHEVRRRYGHTRICWQIGERLREQLPAQPAVDVCLVTWNSSAVVPRLMEHLAATRWPELQVWITDNGSTDDTVARLQAHAATFPFPVHIETLPQNVGVAQALNLAFRRGSAPLVARLDDDAFVPPDWLERLVPNFHQRPYAGLVGPRTLNDNEGGSLQNGPSRGWPGPLPGTGPADRERVRGKARVHAICGCCNLYRRSVFRHAGLLDIRFSPSQFDESDHHVALHRAGYEAIYDGSVTVHHQRNAGRSETPAAVGNFAGNKHKHNAKWAGRQWQAIDRAIDLSIDGRFLPADGDTSALWARLPPVPAGPPAAGATDPVAQRRWTAVARRLSLLRCLDGPLGPWWRNQVTLCEQAIGDRSGHAPALVARLRDLLPHDPRALLAVARWQAIDGELSLARRTIGHALRLQPDDVELAAAARALAAVAAPPLPIPRPEAGRATVVLLAPIAIDREVEARMAVLQSALQAAGIDTRVDRDLVPDVRGAAVVHAFPDERTTLLGRVQVARAMAPAARVLWSPMQVDPARAEWNAQALASVYFEPADTLRRVCRAIVQGDAEVGGRRDRRLPLPIDADHDAYLQRTLALVDGVVTFHAGEAEWLQTRCERLPPLLAVDEAVPAMPPPPPSPAGAGGERGGVLLLGARDLVDNHLPAVLALADSGLPLCLAGDCAHPYGDWHLLRLGGPGLSVVGAVRGADELALLRRHGVLLWLPSAAASLRIPLLAAAAGCELVLARDQGAEAVFGPHAAYVDPFDLDAVRQAVQAAARSAAAGPGRAAPWRQELARQRSPAALARALRAAYRLGSAVDCIPEPAPADSRNGMARAFA